VLPASEPIVLAVTPPDRAQVRLALATAGALTAAFLVTAPFATVPLARLDAFIPAVQTALFVTNLITAVLLFAQFYVEHWRALLVLAGGYLFTALIVVPQALVFPGVFPPLAGRAGPQSAAWLYYFWHAGFPAAVIGYVRLRERDGEAPVRGSTRANVVRTLVVVVALAGALTWLAIVHPASLPDLLLDTTRLSPMARYVSGGVSLLTVAALGLLWLQRRSVLDLWLGVALFASLPDIALAIFFQTVRFNAGWYAARGYALVAGTLVLVVLLSQTTRLYIRLARANLALRHEREARLLTLDSLAGAIAHEINQPLTSIITTGQASKRLLAQAPPALEEVREALQDIVDDGRRAAEVIAGLRAVIGRDTRQMTPFAVNGVVHEVLRSVGVELRAHQVSALTDLADGLPPVHGNRVLVEHVLLNLITNAIEAMDPVTERPRVLQIRSGVSDAAGILVTVEDSGPGIGASHQDAIFEPFFTTKANGMGMGLAICRSIIELHGGKLWVSHARPHGTIFHVELPAAFAG
jgi:signal transduction histidine kinase